MTNTLDEKLIKVLNRARSEQKPDARILLPQIKQAFADEYDLIPKEKYEANDD